MSKQFDVAVVGATSLVGEALIELLAEQSFPVGQLYTLDGEDEAGGRVEFNKEQLRVEDVAGFDFSRAQLVPKGTVQSPPTTPSPLPEKPAQSRPCPPPLKWRRKKRE